ncbi:MAG: restriction endonuclease subunit S, partial [Candidatus Peribacteraceae bacterium]|nr:restriction endonuclease subunit S [Candidatus Peribacteraceae bacterium]
GVPTLNRNDVHAHEALLPPLPEQQRIVSVLEIWDKAIEKLELKIKLKKNVKKGLMQQLLTGKKRLPGFSGEWVEVKLGDVCKIKTGKKDNKDKIENGQYPFFVRSPNIERINTFAFDGEAILVPGEGNIGSIFHYIDGKFDYHQRVYKISDFNDKSFGKFIYYYLFMNFGRHALQSSVKATVDSLRLPMFTEFAITIPKEDEQRAIAVIFTSADQEIELLQSKLQKLKDQKTYLLNNLITGRIRIPETMSISS